jgi:hypothetical protein
MLFELNIKGYTILRFIASLLTSFKKLAGGEMGGGPISYPLPHSPTLCASAKLYSTSIVLLTVSSTLKQNVRTLNVKN